MTDPKEQKRKHIIHILKNKENLLFDYSQKRKNQFEEIKRLQKELECLEIPYENNFNNECRKQGETLLNLYMQSLREINQKENFVNFVWYEFLQLPYELRNLLEELYVKQSGWEYVMATFCGAKNMLCKKKNTAIDMIIENVNEILGREADI